MLLLAGNLRRNSSKMIFLNKEKYAKIEMNSPKPILHTSYRNISRNSYRLSQIIQTHSYSEVAQELTIIQTNFAQKVKIHEFVGKSWTLPFNDVAPNLIRLIQRSNQVSYWVATIILTASSANAQASLVKQFILIAKKLLTINNFETFTQIVNGLDHSSVSRLKTVFKSLPPYFIQALHKFKQITSPNSSYKTYRKRLLKVEGPYFPILAVALHDLAAKEEVTPNFRQENLVNFDKMKLLYTETKNMTHMFQTYSYSTAIVSPLTISGNLESPVETNTLSSKATTSKRRISRTLAATFRLQNLASFESACEPATDEMGTQNSTNSTSNLGSSPAISNLAENLCEVSLHELLLHMEYLDESELYERSQIYEPRSTTQRNFALMFSNVVASAPSTPPSSVGRDELVVDSPRSSPNSPTTTPKLESNHQAASLPGSARGD
eukprot:TRINITY_DN4141_c0_g1_i2.p1 TRINITY_DN4141_c0_g1~~TRINITY_DN4141_c0_g1_i2.p1  ORF type:complete len:437 (+),score=56.83 TRINITY_DN4141_c0_g1_i2:295-1605(+)